MPDPVRQGEGVPLGVDQCTVTPASAADGLDPDCAAEGGGLRPRLTIPESGLTGSRGSRHTDRGRRTRERDSSWARGGGRKSAIAAPARPAVAKHATAPIDREARARSRARNGSDPDAASQPAVGTEPREGPNRPDLRPARYSRRRRASSGRLACRPDKQSGSHHGRRAEDDEREQPSLAHRGASTLADERNARLCRPPWDPRR
jgi:hypothetical protein